MSIEKQTNKKKCSKCSKKKNLCDFLMFKGLLTNIKKD